MSASKAKDCRPPGETQAKGPRASKATRWRVWTLILVHLLFAAHVVHYLHLSDGSTLGLVEPSEAMEFSKHSIINIGFVFFVLMIASTLVLGRFFCGWACHLVALQDMCRAFMIKLGIRPRPLRSGVLLLVPLAAAFYMFFWPAFYRVLIAGEPLPEVTTHLYTDEMWRTMPGWIVGIATLITCGFAAVYFLGAKGFCTYACPYGAIFGVADGVAPGRIRVTDACEGCGHCTATCTSNVQVSQEVRDYGMVVDPGCMKCLDCVSVCPKDALYFGFGKPAAFARPRREVKPGRKLSLPSGVLLVGATALLGYQALTGIHGIEVGWSLFFSAVASAILWRSIAKSSLELWEEAVLAIGFLLAFAAFRGLYGRVPFLWSLGLSTILAFVCLQLARLAAQPAVKLQTLVLKRDGQMQRSGWTLVASVALFTPFWVHSGLVKYHAWRAEATYASLHDAQRDWFSPERPAVAPERVQALIAHAQFVREWTLFADPATARQEAWGHLFAGDANRFRATLERAVEHTPDARLSADLGRYELATGSVEAAAGHYAAARAGNPSTPIGAFSVEGERAARAGQVERARSIFEAGLELDPNDPQLAFNYAILLGMVAQSEGERGRATLETSLDYYRRALAADPGFSAARENLAGGLCALGRFDEGIALFRESLQLGTDDPAGVRALIAQALAGQGDLAGARAEVEIAVRDFPDRTDLWGLLAQLREALGDAAGAVEARQKAAQGR